MKKILAIIFSIFYFGFSSGAVFRIHYCMDKLVSVNQKMDDICSNCGMKNKKDCCKTEIKLVKADDSQKSDMLKIEFQNHISEIQKHEFLFIDKSFSATRFTPIKIKSPPENWTLPIFIHYCNFRI